MYASSGCIYPLYIQTDPDEVFYLTEDKAGPPYDPDGLYGLAKLLAKLHAQGAPRRTGVEDGVVPLLHGVRPARRREPCRHRDDRARGFLRQDPFEVWGTGEQVPNGTDRPSPTDIAEGTVLADERIEDGTAINLGTMERVRVLDAVRMVIEMAGHSPDVVTQPDKPTGP